MAPLPTLRIPEKKRALVLPGGGGRGAYQVGVIKAFAELGIKFDMIFGTSIGALNGIMMAQGSIDRLEQLWGNMRPWDVFKLPSPQQIGRMVFGRKLGLLDTAPLEALLRREVDLKKLKAQTAQIGLFTTDLCCLETRLVDIQDILSTNELIDVLMATAAVPIAFPPRQLHGSGLWVDGGLVRNTPMRAAIDRGAEEIFMVLLHPEQVNVCPTNMWQLLARCLDIVLDASARKELEMAELFNRLIEQGSREATGMQHVNIELFQPRKAVNMTLLEIDPDVSKKLIQQGYEDALDHLVAKFQEETARSA
jgi:NTE family protein